ncbi:hypothetical protein LSTR_LSTR006738 [Laodelphax striatellus]|uniref:Uncharacterized protein n=1 Tax=Laodelphax striatellus TaxID=195883 RepID=A0A482XVC1_LAOST|nr:hypothetical protein LSTR_LSTR006738 [Laodelphax striatellus]
MHVLGYAIWEILCWRCGNQIGDAKAGDDASLSARDEDGGCVYNIARSVAWRTHALTLGRCSGVEEGLVLIEIRTSYAETRFLLTAVPLSKR